MTGLSKMKGALIVMLRDYEAIYGTGDMEMQPAIRQAMNALTTIDSELRFARIFTLAAFGLVIAGFAAFVVIL